MSDYFNALSIGARLAEEREKLGLSKVALAEACGVRREMVGRYEKGEASPGAEVLAKLMVLGMDVAYILTGVRSAAVVAPPPSELTPWEQAHIQNLRECDKEDRDAIARLALRSAEAQHKEVENVKLKKAG